MIVGKLTLIPALSLRLDLDENILVNGHSRERLSDLVRVATDEDQPSSKDSDADSDEGAQRGSDILPRTSCRYCYQLTLEGWGYNEIIETKAHHLKYLCVSSFMFHVYIPYILTSIFRADMGRKLRTTPSRV